MDNENKIKQISKTTNKVQLFLRDSLKAIRRDSPATYNVEEEFAKTKNNKDYFVLGIILAVVLIFGFGTFLITSSINKASRNVKVDISVFEDLNLKNILNLAKKAQDDVNTITDQKIHRQELYQTELFYLEQQEISEKEVLELQRLSSSLKATRIREIEAQYAQLKAELKSQLDSDMALLDIAFEDAKKQLESFDTKRIEEAREQKRLLDNQQDIFELEQQRLKTYYEEELNVLRTKMETIQKENALLKTDQIIELVSTYSAIINSLDPQWEDVQAEEYLYLLDRYSDVGLPYQTQELSVLKTIGLSEENFASLQLGYTALDHILYKIGEFPFEHETKDYILASLKIALLLGNEEQRIINETSNVIASLQKENENQKKSLHAVKQELEDFKESIEEIQKENIFLQENLDTTVKNLEENLEFSKNLLHVKTTFEEAMLANDYDGLILNVDNKAQPFVYFLENLKNLDFGIEPTKVRIFHPPKTIVADAELEQDENGTFRFLNIKLRWGKNIQVLDYVRIIN